MDVGLRKLARIAPGRERVEDLLALFRRRDDPVADLVDGALAADAPAGRGIDLADADAGRRRAAGQQAAALFTALLARQAALLFVAHRSIGTVILATPRLLRRICGGAAAV